MGPAARLGSVLGIGRTTMQGILRRLLRGVLLAAFGALVVSAGGCASDGGGQGGEPREEPRRDFQQPGFTPFSA